MKKLFLISFFVLLSASAFADGYAGSVSTSQVGGRYEIIQSNIKRSLFFKLDKFTGDVYQYVSSRGGGFTWEKMTVIGKSIYDSHTKITYQLFMGGIASADCILLNIETGETYGLYEDSSNKFLFFSKFE